MNKPLYKSIVFYLFAFLLALIGLYLSIYYHAKKTAHIAPSSDIKIVRTITTEYRPFIKTLSLYGNISSKNNANLIAKETGILNIKHATGTTVNKGQIIASIENSELNHRLSLAKQTEQITKLQYERLLPLLKKGYVSQKDVDEKKQLWINQQQLIDEISNLSNQLNFIAPFNGIIGAYKKRDAAIIKSGDLLVTLYSPNELIVDVDVPCDVFPHIKIGSPAIVLDEQLAITHLQQRLDESNHLCPADIDIKCDDCLIGQTVKVELEVAKIDKSISIPLSATFIKDGKTFVYVVNDNKAFQTEIKTGLQHDNTIAVLEGLNAQQEIVVEALLRLSNGMDVITEKKQ